MCDDRSILLHVRCGGCAKMYQKAVSLPAGRSLPIDGDELMENPEVRELKFKCPKCDAPFAEIVAFKARVEASAA